MWSSAGYYLRTASIVRGPEGTRQGIFAQTRFSLHLMRNLKVDVDEVAIYASFSRISRFKRHPFGNDRASSALPREEVRPDQAPILKRGKLAA